jgi:hypothetical protein
MKSSVKRRVLMLLLAVMLVGTAASSGPFDYGDCYTVNPQFCEYYSGGWCRSGCDPQCSGDVSGEIWYCWQLPQECCY